VNGNPAVPFAEENAMLIKARMGISADGFVATPDGWPALVTAPGFVPAVSHGYPEFIEGVDAVVMGRNTFVPALRSPQSPWQGLQVFVLTSRPLPEGTPADVVVSEGGPAGLLEQLRSRGSDGDVHLVGGPATIQAFRDLGALDRLELVVLPVLLGAGVPLSPAGTGPVPLRLDSTRRFPDGSVELAYAAK
jgi:dihydrofolate reductase